MTAKVRREFVTLVPVGAAGGVETDQPFAFWGEQELTTVGTTVVSSSAAPQFGSVLGNALTAGIARVTALSGAAIVAVGASPTPSESNGFRVEPGQPLDIPIVTGQLVAMCEAADPPSTGGSTSSSGGAAPVAYANATGSPFTLTSAWAKVCTTTSGTKALRIAPIGTATAYDIEWAAVTAGAAAPTDTYGEAIQGGEDFAGGIPIGDIYLKSATGQIAVVREG